MFYTCQVTIVGGESYRSPPPDETFEPENGKISLYGVEFNYDENGALKAEPNNPTYPQSVNFFGRIVCMALPQKSDGAS